MIRSALNTLLLLLTAGCHAQSPDPSAHVYLASIPFSEYDSNILSYAGQAYEGATLDEVWDATSRDTEAFLASIPDDSLHTAYARGKWTVAQVLQHIISYEFIMAESALMIAGKAPQPLRYQRYTQRSTAAGTVGKSREDLLREFRAARAYSREVLASLSESEQRIVGRHEVFRTSARVLALCISGHQAHHFGVIRERYL